MAAGEFDHERREMVEVQLARHGVTDPRVLEAMERIPRHRFLPPELWESAYAPRAVDIGDRQTISQPFMVGTMTQALGLSGHDRVLEIGTGSGYQAAILGYLARSVVSVERIPSLAGRARATLDALGLSTVAVVVGDGSSPHFLRGRFDRILVTAAAPALPEGLLQRLRDPGVLVCPVGDDELQTLHVVERSGGVDRLSTHTPCRFVPLLGEGGFRRDPLA